MNVRVISTGAFFAGPEIVALGYPARWFEHEIREIPSDLWEKLKKERNSLSDDPGTLKAYEGLQRGHEARNRLWREEQEARQQKQLGDYQEQAIQDEVNRLLALEHAEKIAKLRKIAAKKLGL